MSPTVLVVEDNDILRMLIAEALSVLEACVVEASCADDALQILEKANSIDLVLTDICMPGQINGLELAELIWVRWPDLPVIVTSGHKQLSAAQLPTQAAFMAKPWTLDTLFDAVQELLPAFSFAK